MDIKWLVGYEGDKEQRKKRVRSMKPTLDELKEILEAEFLNVPPSYDKPSWAFAQAHQNGYNAALKRVISIITI